MPRFFPAGVDRFQKCNITFWNKGYEIDVITHTSDKHLLARIPLLVRMLLNGRQIALKDMGHDLFKRSTPLFLQQPVLHWKLLFIKYHNVCLMVTPADYSLISCRQSNGAHPSRPLASVAHNQPLSTSSPLTTPPGSNGNSAAV